MNMQTWMRTLFAVIVSVGILAAPGCDTPEGDAPDAEEPLEVASTQEELGLCSLPYQANAGRAFAAKALGLTREHARVKAHVNYQVGYAAWMSFQFNQCVLLCGGWPTVVQSAPASLVYCKELIPSFLWECQYSPNTILECR